MIYIIFKIKFRIRGFEPLLPAPKAGVLPSYTIFCQDVKVRDGLEPSFQDLQSKTLPIMLSNLKKNNFLELRINSMFILPGRITGLEPVFSESQSDTFTI